MNVGDLVKIKRGSWRVPKGSIGLITKMHRVRYDKVHFLCEVYLCESGGRIRLADEEVEVIE